ncbi:hypothetical protein HYV81_05785 [Candidatus Woesearchaeota archaeon]|nr:hypothetical protein [Candidatus Woesearchaeota archaeon]
MIQSFIDRENEIFDILLSFQKAGLDYVLVGGYAVSAYMHRFSVDADICIETKDLSRFREVLKAKRFEMTKRKDLEDIYKGQFESYKKNTKLPVTVDVMVGSLASRQTQASFSFALLHAHSILKKITGIERTIEARIPKKELLVASKIHSGRLTDARDIVALCKDIDFDAVLGFMHVGNQESVHANTMRLLGFFKSKNFNDSFKGVFSIERLPIENIKNAIELMEKIIGT